MVREYRKGRPIAEILEDPYVRAWSTAEERASLLKRPNVASAIREHAMAEMRPTDRPDDAKMGPPTHWRESRSSAPSH